MCLEPQLYDSFSQHITYGWILAFIHFPFKTKMLLGTLAWGYAYVNYSRSQALWQGLKECRNCN